MKTNRADDHGGRIEHGIHDRIQVKQFENDNKEISEEAAQVQRKYER